jgi:hypothetical protein
MTAVFTRKDSDTTLTIGSIKEVKMDVSKMIFIYDDGSEPDVFFFWRASNTWTMDGLGTDEFTGFTIRRD